MESNGLSPSECSPSPASGSAGVLQLSSEVLGAHKLFTCSELLNGCGWLSLKVANPTLMSSCKLTGALANDASLGGSNRAPNSGGFECSHPIRRRIVVG